MTDLIIGANYFIYLILLYPSMIEQHTNLIFTAFFFFFYNYSFALDEIFFMADVVIRVLTTEVMLFCGSSFITYCFFWPFEDYYYSTTSG